MQITKSIEWAMAHRLPDHKGLCKNIHGHTYKAVITISGQTNKQNMLMDFTELKEIMNKVIIEPFDHALVLRDNDPILKRLLKSRLKIRVIYGQNPTAEVLANYFRGAIHVELELRKTNCKMVSVEVFETQTSSAKA